jgi:hypothetical protein
MLKKSRYNQYRNTVITNSFLWQWSLNALGFVLLAGLVIGIGAAFLPFSCFLISCCLGVGAEAIGWVLPIALLLTGVGVAAVVGRYVGQRQQTLLETHLSIQINWQSATQYGLMSGFGFASLLLMPLNHLFAPMDGDMTCYMLVCAVTLPFISLAVGITQWWQLRCVVDNAWQWVGVHLLSSLILSAILVISTITDIQIRLLNATLILICVGLLKLIMRRIWYGVIMNLAAIAFISSSLWFFADDVLGFIGVKTYAVESAFLLVYLTFLAGVLTMFKAHLEASALLEML